MKLLITLVVLLTISACGKSKNGSSKPPILIVTPPIVGTWYSGCITAGSISQDLTLKFTVTTFEMYSKTHSNPTCSAPSSSQRDVLDYTYDETTTDLALTQKKMYLMFTDTQYLLDLNDPADAGDIYCGELDWVAGVEKDVTDKLCNINSTTSGQSYNTTLVFIDANSIDFLGLTFTKQ